MKFGSILKAMGGIGMKLLSAGAPTVLPAVGNLLIGPVWTLVITNVVSAVMSAEEPGIPGEEKKGVAMKYLSVGASGIIKVVEATTGRDLVDDDLFLVALGKYIDATVDMMNAFKLLSAKAPASVPFIDNNLIPTKKGKDKEK